MRTIKTVGFDRPGVKFPEDPDTFFFTWLVDTIHKKFGGYPVTPGFLDRAREEALQLLNVANDLYRLRTDLSFWHVHVEDQGLGTLVLTVRPKALGDEHVHVDHHKDGGFVARVGEDFVRGPTKIEAIIGLGRLLEVKGRATPQLPSAVSRIVEFTEDGAQFGWSFLTWDEVREVHKVLGEKLNERDRRTPEDL